MGSCNAGLYSVFPPVVLFIAQVCLGDHCGFMHCLQVVMQGLFPSWVLEALTTKKGHETFLFFFFAVQKALVGLSDATCMTEARISSLLWQRLFLSQGSREAWITLPDWRHFQSLSVEQMPPVASVWVGMRFLDLRTWVLLPLGKILSQPVFISLTLTKLRPGLTDLTCGWNLPPPPCSHDSCCREARQLPQPESQMLQVAPSIPWRGLLSLSERIAAGWSKRFSCPWLPRGIQSRLWQSPGCEFIA